MIRIEWHDRPSERVRKTQKNQRQSHSFIQGTYIYALVEHGTGVESGGLSIGIASFREELTCSSRTNFILIMAVALNEFQFMAFLLFSYTRVLLLPPLVSSTTTTFP